MLECVTFVGGWRIFCAVGDGATAILATHGLAEVVLDPKHPNSARSLIKVRLVYHIHQMNDALFGTS